MLVQYFVPNPTLALVLFDDFGVLEWDAPMRREECLYGDLRVRLFRREFTSSISDWIKILSS